MPEQWDRPLPRESGASSQRALRENGIRVEAATENCRGVKSLETVCLQMSLKRTAARLMLPLVGRIRSNWRAKKADGRAGVGTRR